MHRSPQEAEFVALVQLARRHLGSPAGKPGIWFRSTGAYATFTRRVAALATSLDVPFAVAFDSIEIVAVEMGRPERGEA